MGNFNYSNAFCRNIGLITNDEQNKFKNTTVCIAGLGGLGGLYATGLARAGIGKFKIADGDIFEEGNTNRQDGCRQSTYGRNKAEVIKETILDINPSAEVIIWKRYLEENDLEEFLNEADILVDAIELFTPDIHRSILNKAYELKIPSFFGAPLGWSAAAIAFHPNAMHPEKWFDWNKAKNYHEKLAHLMLGVSPLLIHHGEVDYNHVDIEKRRGPSNISACYAAAGIIVEAVQETLLNQNFQKKTFAPYFVQFDMKKKIYKNKKKSKGNRALSQKIKKVLFIRHFNREMEKKEKIKTNFIQPELLTRT